MSDLVVLLDDGGVMNDNSLRAPQWQRLMGEFFPSILGGTPDAWAEANRIVAPKLWLREYLETVWARTGRTYSAFYRVYQLDWLTGMCELVGVPAPPEEQALALANRATAYAIRRVRSALPGAVEAIRTLQTSGYRLHTASSGASQELDGILTGMGVRECFDRLYGADLVNCFKEATDYYPRIFADLSIDPANALVVDDNPAALHRAALAGAKTALVGVPVLSFVPDLVINSLAELPEILLRADHLVTR